MDSYENVMLKCDDPWKRDAWLRLYRLWLRSPNECVAVASQIKHPGCIKWMLKIRAGDDIPKNENWFHWFNHLVDTAMSRPEPMCQKASGSPGEFFEPTGV